MPPHFEVDGLFLDEMAKQIVLESKATAMAEAMKNFKKFDRNNDNIISKEDFGQLTHDSDKIELHDNESKLQERRMEHTAEFFSKFGKSLDGTLTLTEWMDHFHEKFDTQAIEQLQIQMAAVMAKKNKEEENKQ